MVSPFLYIFEFFSPTISGLEKQNANQDRECHDSKQADAFLNVHRKKSLTTGQTTFKPETYGRDKFWYHSVLSPPATRLPKYSNGKYHSGGLNNGAHGVRRKDLIYHASIHPTGQIAGSKAPGPTKLPHCAVYSTIASSSKRQLLRPHQLSRHHARGPPPPMCPPLPRRTPHQSLHSAVFIPSKECRRSGCFLSPNSSLGSEIQGWQCGSCVSWVRWVSRGSVGLFVAALRQQNSRSHDLVLSQRLSFSFPKPGRSTETRSYSRF